jgi:hypothetical protein
MYKKGRRYLVAPEPFGDGVRDLEECSGRGSEESAARTYCCSGRTWTLLALRSFRSDLDVAASSCSGRRERRVKGGGMAGVPSRWEGTGQEKAGRPGFPRNGRERARKAEKAGKPGFPRNGRERARRKREGRGSLAMGGNGPGKRRKRESRGSLAMGGNGPGKEKAGKPGFPRNGRERASGESGKAGVPSRWEGTGQESGESGKAGVPSQWEGTGQESGESGKAGVPSQWEGTGQESGESGLLVESEAESESVLELEEDRDRK